MDNARAQELVASERARLERLLRAEIGATAPDQGDDVDDANWRIAEETGRAVSRSLRDRWSALERAEERLERGTYGRSIASGRPIPDERLEADPLAELLVEEAAVEAFRARRSTETVSGLTSTRRTLAALADRGEGTDDSRGSATSPQTEEPEGEEDVQSPEDSEDLDVEELEDGELIDEDDDEEAPAEFEDEAEHAQDAEDEEPQEAQEEQAAEEEEERPPQRRRSGRG
jgi:RNA polymerase-binding transcription factor